MEEGKAVTEDAADSSPPTTPAPTGQWPRLALHTVRPTDAGFDVVAQTLRPTMRVPKPFAARPPVLQDAPSTNAEGDLAKIAAKWDKLPESIRRAILALIEG